MPWLVLAILTLLPQGAQADQVYLQADFNDKPIDERIGTGGPALGEPIAVAFGTVDAVVRNAPFATPCLQMLDLSDCCAGSAWFEFLDGVEVTTAAVEVHAEVWVPQALEGGYVLGVRERGSAAHTFVDLHFDSAGQVGCGDAGGSIGAVAVYATASVVSVRIALDMDAGTYDVWINGLQCVNDQPHDVVGAGVGAVFVSCGHDPGLGDFIYLDNLFVGDYDPTPAVPATWGAVKGLYR